MKYTEKIRQKFENQGNKSDAQSMSAYLLDQFAFLGIKQPLRKKLQKDFFAENGYPPSETLEKTLKTLWNFPEREFQYVAMDLLERNIKKVPANFLNLCEYLITHKSWWDTVDLLASKSVGTLLARFPEQKIPVTQKWIASENIWLQRTALLFQLKYKEKTDTDLLISYIEKLSGSKEFFIQKAIGWILREYSKTNPDFVKKHLSQAQVAPLSRREALRWLKKHGNAE